MSRRKVVLRAADGHPASAQRLRIESMKDVGAAAPYRRCIQCVMDTTDPLIQFDRSGVCSHCRKYEAYLSRVGDASARAAKLDAIVKGVQDRGRGRDYDCLMGLSGGVDSSYLAWFAVRHLGLRPLVVHVDAGWNSELAVNNIQNVVRSLSLDLHTVVVDWQEVRDIQRAYFLSGVANLDVAQDHAFIASLYRVARERKIRDILSGGNMQTESILPTAWGYDASDSTSLVDIHAKFGSRPLKTYPIMTNLQRFFVYPYWLRLRVHRPLEYIDYRKDAAKKVLLEELGWRDYGGKHFESVFTKFFQAHYLPVKFGYDKRLAHYSSLIVSGQLSRDQALADLALPLYSEADLENDLTYWIKKLGLSRDKYDQVMRAAPVEYSEYRNSEDLRRWLIRLAQIVQLPRRWVATGFSKARAAATRGGG
jgi:N-acetyl sugar amidotransferase